ncbi:MAG: hypothetical protein M4579_004475 [Chaenotheca gracillima]|nr:MAG: hypothetical protein M4579_004475 [Chaenotheca gracillima]
MPQNSTEVRSKKDQGKKKGKASKPTEPKSRTSTPGQGQGSKDLKPSSGSTTNPFSLELQQQLLNLFKTSFSSSFSGQLSSILQEIKGHLYKREFDRAFGSEEFLEAYAVRWSPSRALCYLSIFRAYLRDCVRKLERQSAARDQAINPGNTVKDGELGQEDCSTIVGSDQFKVTCLGGGGGAELVALAGWLAHRHSSSHVGAGSHNSENRLPISLSLIDIADWSMVLKKLETSIHATFCSGAGAEASEEPSETSKLPLAPDKITLQFHQHDLLKMPVEDLQPLIQGSHVITLMFTLNELYSASMGQTTKLLLQISSFLQKGVLLLVVDSPGSYSTVSVGDSQADTTQKKYPMHWLLDHTLLSDDEKKDRERGWRWEKLATNESQWFRLPAELKYPIGLEDMRYQAHLYRLE